MCSLSDDIRMEKSPTSTDTQVNHSPKTPNPLSSPDKVSPTRIRYPRKAKTRAARDIFGFEVDTSPEVMVRSPPGNVRTIIPPQPIVVWPSQYLDADEELPHKQPVASPAKGTDTVQEEPKPGLTGISPIQQQTGGEAFNRDILGSPKVSPQKQLNTGLSDTKIVTPVKSPIHPAFPAANPLSSLTMPLQVMDSKGNLITTSLRVQVPATMPGLFEGALAARKPGEMGIASLPFAPGTLPLAGGSPCTSVPSISPAKLGSPPTYISPANLSISPSTFASRALSFGDGSTGNLIPSISPAKLGSPPPSRSPASLGSSPKPFAPANSGSSPTSFAPTNLCSSPTYFAPANLGSSPRGGPSGIPSFSPPPPPKPYVTLQSDSSKFAGAKPGTLSSQTAPAKPSPTNTSTTSIPQSISLSPNRKVSHHSSHSDSQGIAKPMKKTCATTKASLDALKSYRLPQKLTSVASRSKPSGTKTATSMKTSRTSTGAVASRRKSSKLDSVVQRLFQQATSSENVRQQFHQMTGTEEMTKKEVVQSDSVVDSFAQDPKVSVGMDDGSAEVSVSYPDQPLDCSSSGKKEKCFAEEALDLSVKSKSESSDDSVDPGPLVIKPRKYALKFSDEPIDLTAPEKRRRSQGDETDDMHSVSSPAKDNAAWAVHSEEASAKPLVSVQSSQPFLGEHPHSNRFQTFLGERSHIERPQTFLAEQFHTNWPQSFSEGQLPSERTFPSMSGHNAHLHCGMKSESSNEESARVTEPLCLSLKKEKVDQESGLSPKKESNSPNAFPCNTILIDDETTEPKVEEDSALPINIASVVSLLTATGQIKSSKAKNSSSSEGSDQDICNCKCSDGVNSDNKESVKASGTLIPKCDSCEKEETPIRADQKENEIPLMMDVEEEKIAIDDMECEDLRINVKAKTQDDVSEEKGIMEIKSDDLSEENKPTPVKKVTESSSTTTEIDSIQERKEDKFKNRRPQRKRKSEPRNKGTGDSSKSLWQKMMEDHEQKEAAGENTDNEDEVIDLTDNEAISGSEQSKKRVSPQVTNNTENGNTSIPDANEEAVVDFLDVRSPIEIAPFEQGTQDLGNGLQDNDSNTSFQPSYTESYRHPRDSPQTVNVNIGVPQPLQHVPETEHVPLSEAYVPPPQFFPEVHHLSPIQQVPNMEHVPQSEHVQHTQTVPPLQHVLPQYVPTMQQCVAPLQSCPPMGQFPSQQHVPQHVPQHVQSMQHVPQLQHVPPLWQNLLPSDQDGSPSTFQHGAQLQHVPMSSEHLPKLEHVPTLQDSQPLEHVLPNQHGEPPNVPVLTKHVPIPMPPQQFSQWPPPPDWSFNPSGQYGDQKPYPQLATKPEKKKTKPKFQRDYFITDDVQFDEGKRNRPILKSGGYKYYRNKIKNGRTWFMCSGYKTHKCKASAFMEDDTNMVRIHGTHTHPPDYFKRKAEEAEGRMRKRARTDLHKTLKEIYKEESSKILEQGDPKEAHKISKQLTSAVSIASTLNRSRKNSMPVLPKVLADMDMDSVPNCPDILIDSGADERIVVAGSAENLKLVCDSEQVHIDGVYKSSLDLFSQLFIIHAQVNDRVWPLLYCLLPGKDPKIYTQLFHLLKTKATELGLNLSPAVIWTDFDESLWQSLQSVWSEVKIKLFYFQYCQAIKRRISRAGLTNRLNQSGTVRTILLRCLCLPFLPVKDILSTFEMIEDTSFWGIMEGNVSSQLGRIVRYMHRTWLESEMGPEHYSIWSTDMSTINAIEACNSVVNAELRSYKRHRNVYELLGFISGKLELTRLDISQTEQGVKAHPQTANEMEIDAAKALFASGQLNGLQFLNKIVKICHPNDESSDDSSS